MLTKDIRYAFRSLRRNPGFALVAIITLALGIGVSTAIFSVVNVVLVTPLPYKDPERLVLVWGDMRNRNVTDFPFSPPDFQDLRNHTTAFESLAGVLTFRSSLADESTAPEQIVVGSATTNFFRQMGARIILGRDFNDSDGLLPVQANANNGDGQAPLPNMVMLTQELWQRRYGSDPKIIGRSIEIANAKAEVVGVLAPGFELLLPPSTSIERHPQAWIAMRPNFNGSRLNVFMRVIGRLKPGVTIAQAQKEADDVATDLRKRFVISETAGLHLRVEPMRADLVADVKPAIIALMGAVIFVLLIACANVANLVLVRASWREREFAVRSALGATRSRLVAQMLTESVVIAGAAGLLGIILAQIGMQLLLYISPDNLPRIDSVSLDWRVLSFALFSSLVAASVFGLAPALRASRVDVIETLRRGGRSGGMGTGNVLRNGVVVAEVALSFVLLVGCGLMLRTFAALQRVDPGFDPKQVFTFETSGVFVMGQPARAQFIRSLRDKLATIPGVRSLTAASMIPLDGQIANARWGTEDALANPGKFQQATLYIVQPGYFETLGTRLLEGRTFAEPDNIPELRRLVIDQRLAQKAFPNQSAVGKRLLTRINTDQPEVYEVIGVVAHQRHNSLASEGRESIYVSDGMMGSGRTNRWMLRVDGDPLAIAPTVRGELTKLYPTIVLSELKPMESFVSKAMAQTRFALTLIAIFAVIAAILAAVGLYSVLSTVVRMRTGEIGVRLALGATPQNVFKLVVNQGLKLSVVGVVLGLLGSFSLTRVIGTLLVGVRPTDPLTFATIAIVFVIIAMIASWLPARRAANVEPTVALRES